jgi:hypothetical protein
MAPFVVCAVGSVETIEIVPDPAWKAGETYALRFLPALSDAAGNAWGRTAEVKFTVESTQVLDTYLLAENVRDIARLGSWLFRARGASRLSVCVFQFSRRFSGVPRFRGPTPAVGRVVRHVAGSRSGGPTGSISSGTLFGHLVRGARVTIGATA